MNARAQLWEPAPVRRAPPTLQPLLPVHAARLLSFTGLALFGALHWARLVQPVSTAALLGALAAALATAFALLALASRRPPARVRVVAMLLAAAALTLVAFAVAGVPLRYLSRPRLWDDLAAGIGQGLGAVPSVRVPYKGLDEWVRIVIVLGGAILLAAAALLAFAVRRDGAVGYPLPAAIVLATLYATVIVQRHSDHPFLAGAGFALLLACFLWLERLERRSAAIAGAAVAAAVVLALMVAPLLDGERPLLDYEELAQSLSRSATTQYDWDHRYGPLEWPRDGREVLRVRTSARAYWKAVNLVAFDGIRWRQAEERQQAEINIPIDKQDWLERIQVTVRALQSSQFVAAGTTLQVTDTPRAFKRSAPGRFDTAGRPLRRGQAYRARIYLPRPTEDQLRAAGTAYPPDLTADYAGIELQRGPPSGEQIRVGLPFWGHVVPPGVTTARDEALRASPYARTYALAQRLRAQSASPYDYMRAIERFLRNGFSYTENPTPSALPLDTFLFKDKVGYCQQFSGAMALLLRLGGVPARIAAGFSPGVLDRERRDYVVRDVDAHSWVEVYFPDIGWVTRDPTPAVSPARSQTSDVAAASADAPVSIGRRRERDAGAATDPGGADAAGGGGAAEGPSLSAGTAIAVLLAIAALALAFTIVLRRRARRTAAGEDRRIAELRRALERSGRAPQPQLTLEALAQRLHGTVAEEYVRALASQRYGYGGDAPTSAQRAGLRRELAAGLGLRGQVRAWWALPPRVGR